MIFSGHLLMVPCKGEVVKKAISPLVEFTTFKSTTPFSLYWLFAEEHHIRTLGVSLWISPDSIYSICLCIVPKTLVFETLLFMYSKTRY
jgi:hypothetical protein